MKLLVIDDEEAVAQIVSEIAAQGGWESTHRSRVQDIIGLVKEELPDVAMIDYRMPGRNGLELIQTLRDAGSQLPVVLFTGFASEVNEDLCRKLGVFAILEKPLSIPELRKTLNLAVKSPGRAGSVPARTAI
jgi:DNA-binding response OmpR family regulator